MSNELATTSAPTAVQSLADGKQTVFSTIKGDSVEARLAVFAAVTASVPLDEHLGKPIKLANMVVQDVEMAQTESDGVTPVVDPSTGEVKTSIVPRTILIDADGVAYHAISKGLFRSVENLVGILGSDPDKWGGLSVVATREGNPGRKYFTLRPVLDDSKSKASK